MRWLSDGGGGLHRRVSSYHDTAAGALEGVMGVLAYQINENGVVFFGCYGRQAKFSLIRLDISQAQIIENSGAGGRDAGRPCGEAEERGDYRSGFDGCYFFGMIRNIVFGIEPGKSRNSWKGERARRKI